MLACFLYFLGYLQFYLTRARKTKVVKGDFAMYSIGRKFDKDVSICDVSVEAVSVKDFSIGNTCIGAGLSSTDF